jgi:hypothetical protein
MVEWYRPGKLRIRPESSLKIPQAESSNDRAGVNGENDEFVVTKYLYSYVEGMFEMP